MINPFYKGALALLVVASCSLTGLSYAQDVIKMDCRLTDQLSADNQPGEPKDTFNTKTPKIYAYCTSNELKKDQVLKAVWFADNTHGVAPDNTKIIEKTIAVPQVPDNKLYFNFGMTKPTSDWPAGTYHVEIFVDDQKEPQQNLKFTISANQTTE